MSNNHKGYIALIASIVLSVATLTMAVSGLHDIATIFDLVVRKGYRQYAVVNSLACFDIITYEFAHDYFYSVDKESAVLPDVRCTIVSVVPVSSTSQPIGAVKEVVTHGFSGDINRPIIATIYAELLVLDSGIVVINGSVSF